MKRIIKTEPPDFFEEWKASFLARNDKIPNYKDNFYGKIKHQFKFELLKEQGYVCCYCMASVNFNSHIEHFLPQSNSDKDLDYFNMFISCNGYHDDRSHCGHKKDDWFDEEKMLSPTASDIEQQFKYSIDGSIIPTSERAAENIRHLGLDSFSLNRARQNAIYSSGLFDEDINEEDIEELVLTFQSRNEKGAYLPFCQAVVYCLLNTVI